MMTRQSGTRLTVQATLLSDPPLWCWEIVDATSGALVESSWEGRWEAYASPGEALRHAAPALQRLSRKPSSMPSGAAMIDPHEVVRQPPAFGTLADCRVLKSVARGPAKESPGQK